jgi:hypothetical protein
VRKFIGLILFVITACLPAAAQTQHPIRINCGGPSYTDSKGNVWQADTDYKGGTVSQIQATVTGTTDPALYQDARRDNSSTPLVYAIPVVNGNYHVNLYFAETYAPMEHVGARIFNVKLQGSPVFSNLDVFAEAGANAALEKGAEVTVSNGTLNIEFDNVVDYAKVAAIEILPGVSGPMLMLNFKYPDGTPVIGTLGYAVSSSLLNFQGTEPLTNGSAQCALFTNPSALGNSAQFTVKLSLTDSAGHILWQFNVGMNPADVNLAAVQNSSLNVTVQKM